MWLSTAPGGARSLPRGYTRLTRLVARSIRTSFAPPSTMGPWFGDASSMTHRLFSRSAWMPCVQTNRSPAGKPGRHSFQVPPGNGLKVPSGAASPTDDVGTSVQRGKLPKSLPVGDTAALVIMTLPEEATEISSIGSSGSRRRTAATL